MKKEQRWNEILEASLRNFAAYGFNKTTMQDIAQAAGMMPGNLYAYAESKKELYERTVIWAMARQQQEIFGAAMDAEDAVERFEIATRSLRSFLEADLPVKEIIRRDHRIFTPEALDSAFTEINAAILEFLKTLLNDGISQKKFRPMNVETVSRSIFMILRMFLLESYAGSENTTPRMFDDTIEIFLRGILL